MKQSASTDTSRARRRARCRRTVCLTISPEAIALRLPYGQHPPVKPVPGDRAPGQIAGRDEQNGVTHDIHQVPERRSTRYRSATAEATAVERQAARPYGSDGGQVYRQQARGHDRGDPGPQPDEQQYAQRDLYERQLGTDQPGGLRRDDL